MKFPLSLWERVRVRESAKTLRPLVCVKRETPKPLIRFPLHPPIFFLVLMLLDFGTATRKFLRTQPPIGRCQGIKGSHFCLLPRQIRVTRLIALRNRLCRAGYLFAERLVRLPKTLDLELLQYRGSAQSRPDEENEYIAALPGMNSVVRGRKTHPLRLETERRLQYRMGL